VYEGGGINDTSVHNVLYLIIGIQATPRERGIPHPARGFEGGARC